MKTAYRLGYERGLNEISEFIKHAIREFMKEISNKKAEENEG